MPIMRVLLLCASVLFLTMREGAVAEELGLPFVRIAELEIEPTQVERFNTAAREQIAAAVRVEPGVPGLYAVSLKGNPTQIRVFEMNADENAYKLHLQTPHFKKFREATNEIVKSRKLVAAVPIILGEKKAAPKAAVAPGRRHTRQRDWRN